MLPATPGASTRNLSKLGEFQGCIKLLDFSSSIGWRERAWKRGAFSLVPSLLGPLPLISRGEKMQSLMQPWGGLANYSDRASRGHDHFMRIRRHVVGSRLSARPAD